jgi:hypothetical protein
MHIQLIRKWFSTKSTIGEIFIEGKKICYSLEDVARAEDVKIYGETCIPQGCYFVEVTFSNRYQKKLPLLWNTEGLIVKGKGNVKFEGIRIHPGNTAKDTHGCILPGSSKSEDTVSNSKAAFDILFAKISDAESRGEDITLEIIHQQE